jgi:micrococcal nuclease
MTHEPTQHGFADMPRAGLVEGVAGTASAVPDGDTVLLDNGLHLRLTGIQAPRLSLGRAEIADWPFGSASRDALAALVLGRRVRLLQGATRRDRDGRHLGQLRVEADPPIWAQAHMLALGLARVYSFPDNRACIADLLSIEARARALRLGIWADPYYAVRHADRPGDIAVLDGRYELIEGRVVSALRLRGNIALVFGRDLASGLVVVVTTRAEHEFAALGRNPLNLGGALVRVRSWVEVSGGPRLTITHPEQLEVLSAP